MCPTGTDAAVLHRDAAAKGSDFRPAFEVIDADHDGKISKDDLRTFYAGFYGGGAPAEDEIGSMMSVADANENGFVEYEEFESVLTNGSNRSGHVMEEVFRVMDRDGDGRVGFDDLRSYLKWAGFDAGDEDIRNMIGLGGGDEKQGVTFDGLLKILAV